MNAYPRMRHNESFNFDQFLALCTQLILRGKSMEVRRLINAFDDPDEQLSGLKRLMDLGPNVLGGMLLAFQLRDMRPQPLNLETWPHNVLLLAARETEDCEQFAGLLGTVEETVEWEDTFECITRLCFELSDNVIEDVFLHSERFGYAQPFILANILRVLSIRESDNVPEASAVIEKSRTILDQLRTKNTSYKFYLDWGSRSRSHDIYPSALYALGLIDLMNALEPLRSRFPTVYEDVQIQGFEALHREVRDVNRKDNYQFLWVFKRILRLLGGDVLFQQWKEMMREIVVAH